MTIETLWTGELSDLMWLVGIFDADGCLYKDARPKAGGGYCWRIQIGMSDEDTILHIRALVGSGKMTASTPAENRKKIYYWRLNNQLEVGALLRAMRPHLSARRGALADEALLSL